MEKYTHACIKCANKYQSDEPDAYYCEACTVEKNAIAKEVDKVMANRPKKNRQSDLQAFESQAVRMKSANGGESFFIKA